MQQPNKEELNKSANRLGVFFTIVGLVLTVISGNIVNNLLLTVAGVAIGLGLAGLGVLILIKGSSFGEMYVQRKQALLEANKQKLEDDNRGIVWVWVVALCTWAIMAIAYFSLSIVVYMVLDSVEAFYPWGAEEMGVITLTRNVCAWFLIIMTVGILGWALINSVRRGEDTYPAY